MSCLRRKLEGLVPNQQQWKDKGVSPVCSLGRKLRGERDQALQLLHLPPARLFKRRARLEPFLCKKKNKKQIKTQEAQEGSTWLHETRMHELFCCLLHQWQTAFSVPLVMQLRQSLCNSRPLPPHDWPCCHVQCGDHGKSPIAPPLPVCTPTSPR